MLFLTAVSISCVIYFLYFVIWGVISNDNDIINWYTRLQYNDTYVCVANKLLTYQVVNIIIIITNNISNY